MPRRANDPNLLRAQAQSGREGENAYKQAQQQLTNQRQNAVQRAMQEAAARGAPAGAISQLQGRVAMPYNQAIRSTVESGANFTADMAARRGRMDDYNQAVLAARQLIPVQIQQALAPIRAQNRFQLQSLRQEGANTVAQIEAQTALQLAQMRAQSRLDRLRLQEDRRKARAAGLGTLTEGELKNALKQDARDQINVAATRIGSAVEQGGQRATAQTIQDIIAAAMQASPYQQAAAQAQQTQAAYGLGSMAIGQQIGTTQAAQQAENRPPDVERYHQLYADLGQEDQPGQDYSATGPLMSGQLGEGSQFGQAIAAQQGDATQTEGGMFASWNPNMSVPGAQQADALGIDPAMLAQLASTNQAAALARGQAGQYSEAAAGLMAQAPTGVEPLSQYGMLSERQVANLPPYAESLVRDPRAEPFNTRADIERQLWGAPDFNRQGEATVSPFAQDIKREAMNLAANRLIRQGYDINMPGIQNAILNTPETLFDIEHTAYAQPVTAELGEQVRTDVAARQANRDKRIEVKENQVKDKFRATFDQPMPTNMGTVSEVAEVAFRPDFQSVWVQLLQILQQNDYNLDPDEAINQAFADAGIDPTVGFGFRRILKAMMP